MTHDDDLGDLLRRYRPVDPPPDLRARALTPPAARVWPWVAAAAALLLVTMGADRLNRQLIARAGVAVDPDPAVLAAEQLADLLGGGPDGQAAAALVLAHERWRAERNQVETTQAPALPGVMP